MRQPVKSRENEMEQVIERKSKTWLRIKLNRLIGRVFWGLRSCRIQLTLRRVLFAFVLLSWTILTVCRVAHSFSLLLSHFSSNRSIASISFRDSYLHNYLRESHWCFERVCCSMGFCVSQSVEHKNLFVFRTHNLDEKIRHNFALLLSFVMKSISLDWKRIYRPN